MCVPLTPSSLFLSLCLCRLSRWLFKNEEPLLECSGQSAELLLKSARRGCNRQQKGKRLPEIRTPAPPPRPMVPVPLGIILYATSSQEWQAVESLAFVGPLDIWQRTRKPRFPSVSPSAGKLQGASCPAQCHGTVGPGATMPGISTRYSFEIFMMKLAPIQGLSGGVCGSAANLSLGGKSMEERIIPQNDARTIGNPLVRVNLDTLSRIISKNYLKMDHRPKDECKAIIMDFFPSCRVIYNSGLKSKIGRGWPLILELHCLVVRRGS
ncbi:uncharacterized protein LOC104002446 isoform X3 [Pan troglodytes]|uniref:uncharacterized protein LOC104002446 isoform X3 n=1 Tax=Pan troglodytes TaxID=9598 RepID=UPI0007DBA4D0|nr:uncharacterized protein LOC104002446 isoform X2 [Pan troglodytes]